MSCKTCRKQYTGNSEKFRVRFNNYKCVHRNYLKQSLLTCMLKACSRANVPCVLTCSRANMPCVLKYSPANVSYVLTCSRTNVFCELKWWRVNVSCVLMCSRANLSCKLTYSHLNMLSVPCLIWLAWPRDHLST